MEQHINFTFGHHINKILLTTVVSICFLSCDLSTSHRLRGTHYYMSTYPTHNLHYCDSGEGIVKEGWICSLSWNKQYIIAYTIPHIDDSMQYRYHIIEMLKTDTIMFGLPWTSYSSVPWTNEKFDDQQAFSARLEELQIDTTTMRHRRVR